MKTEKTTPLSLQTKKANSQRITLITAYDYPTAIVAERAEMDMILVGDSLGMVVLGYANTVPVTMEEMLHHCRAVARGAKTPLLIGDMPFMSYQADPAEAVRNAGRFLKEGNMDAIKLEGGVEIAPTVKAIVDAGIAVMGHIGLTPQSVAKLGGFKVQGKSVEAARKLLDDARALEEAGAFSILAEAVPDRLAGLLTQKAGVPIIGIGAGPMCDGQALVMHDVLGMFDGFVSKFVKRYANLLPVMTDALAQWRQETADRTFPGPEHCFTMKDEVYQALLDELQLED